MTNESKLREAAQAAYEFLSRGWPIADKDYCVVTELAAALALPITAPGAEVVSDAGHVLSLLEAGGFIAPGKLAKAWEIAARFGAQPAAATHQQGLQVAPTEFGEWLNSKQGFLVSEVAQELRKRFNAAAGLHDAYRGARDEMLKWKMRAQSYESALTTAPSQSPAPLPEAQPVSDNGAVAWRSMNTAPTDGTLLRLLVAFTDHATEDEGFLPEGCATVGANSKDNTGEDLWQFAGWNWEQDCYTEGKGTVLGWLPMIDETTDALPEAARLALASWVATRWHDEVANRPLVNVHRRSLDDTWRQVLRHLGVDDEARLGPRHDELVQENPQLFRAAAPVPKAPDAEKDAALVADPSSVMRWLDAHCKRVAWSIESATFEVSDEQAFALVTSFLATPAPLEQSS